MYTCYPNVFNKWVSQNTSVHQVLFRLKTFELFQKNFATNKIWLPTWRKKAILSNQHALSLYPIVNRDEKICALYERKTSRLGEILGSSQAGSRLMGWNFFHINARPFEFCNGFKTRMSRDLEVIRRAPCSSAGMNFLHIRSNLFSDPILYTWFELTLL